MELQGTIKKISDLETFSSGFQKTTLILETEEAYPQPISIEFMQDKSDLPSAHKAGDKVTVGINIRGKLWTSPDGVEKYFNSIIGWKIIKQQSSTGGQQEHAQNVAAEKEKSKDKSFADSIDDDPENSLPF